MKATFSFDAIHLSVENAHTHGGKADCTQMQKRLTASRSNANLGQRFCNPLPAITRHFALHFNTQSVIDKASPFQERLQGATRAAITLSMMRATT